VTVTEGVVPGSKVAEINTSGALSPTPATAPAVNPDPLNRTVTVTIGNPVTGPEAEMVGEGVVTFVNTAADPSPLKVCVTKGTPAPVASSYVFSIAGTSSGAAVSGTASVGVGGCSVVGGNTTPTLFDYGSLTTVTGTDVSPDVTSSISATPQFVTQTGGPTTLPVLVTSNLATPSATVMMSEGPATMTELTFVIGAKPAGSGGTGGSGSGGSGSGGSGSGGSGSGGSGSGGSGGSGGGGGATLASGGSGGSGGTGGTGNVTPDVLPQATISSTVTSPSISGTGNDSSSSVSTAALLAADHAHLSMLQKNIETTRLSLAKYHKEWLTAARHHWSSAPRLLKVVQHLQARLKALLTLERKLLLAMSKL
jgi:hypothetical protein